MNNMNTDKIVAIAHYALALVFLFLPIASFGTGFFSISLSGWDILRVVGLNIFWLYPLLVIAGLVLLFVDVAALKAHKDSIQRFIPGFLLGLMAWELVSVLFEPLISPGIGLWLALLLHGAFVAYLNVPAVRNLVNKG